MKWQMSLLYGIGLTWLGIKLPTFHKGRLHSTDTSQRDLGRMRILLDTRSVSSSVPIGLASKLVGRLYDGWVNLAITQPPHTLVSIAGCTETYICIYVFTRVHICVCTCVHVCMCIYICVHAYTYVCVCVYVNMCILCRLYVKMCICIGYMCNCELTVNVDMYAYINISIYAAHIHISAYLYTQRATYAWSCSPYKWKKIKNCFQ